MANVDAESDTAMFEESGRVEKGAAQTKADATPHGGPQRVRLKRIKKKKSRPSLATPTSTKVKSLSARMSATMNNSTLKRTLRANNRALAQMLANVRQNLRTAQQDIISLRRENQELHEQVTVLSRVCGLRNTDIDKEVQRRIEERLQSLTEPLRKAQQLHSEGMKQLNRGMEACLSGGGSSTMPEALKTVSMDSSASTRCLFSPTQRRGRRLQNLPLPQRSTFEDSLVLSPTDKQDASLRDMSLILETSSLGEDLLSSPTLAPIPLNTLAEETRAVETPNVGQEEDAAFKPRRSKRQRRASMTHDSDVAAVASTSPDSAEGEPEPSPTTELPTLEATLPMKKTLLKTSSRRTFFVAPGTAEDENICGVPPCSATSTCSNHARKKSMEQIRSCRRGADMEKRTDAAVSDESIDSNVADLLRMTENELDISKDSSVGNVTPRCGRPDAFAETEKTTLLVTDMELTEVIDCIHTMGLNSSKALAADASQKEVVKTGGLPEAGSSDKEAPSGDTEGTSQSPVLRRSPRFSLSKAIDAEKKSQTKAQEPEQQTTAKELVSKTSPRTSGVPVSRQFLKSKKNGAGKQDSAKSAKSPGLAVTAAEADAQEKALEPKEAGSKVALRLSKPGQMVFKVSRKNDEGKRDAVPSKLPTRSRPRSKKAKQELLDSIKSPTSIWDFSERTPQGVGKSTGEEKASEYDLSMTETEAPAKAKRPTLEFLRKKIDAMMNSVPETAKDNAEVDASSKTEGEKTGKAAGETRSKQPLRSKGRKRGEKEVDENKAPASTRSKGAKARSKSRTSPKEAQPTESTSHGQKRSSSKEKDAVSRSGTLSTGLDVESDFEDPKEKPTAKDVGKGKATVSPAAGVETASNLEPSATSKSSELEQDGVLASVTPVGKRDRTPASHRFRSRSSRRRSQSRGKLEESQSPVASDNPSLSQETPCDVSESSKKKRSRPKSISASPLCSPEPAHVVAEAKTRSRRGRSRRRASVRSPLTTGVDAESVEDAATGSARPARPQTPSPSPKPYRSRSRRRRSAGTSERRKSTPRRRLRSQSRKARKSPDAEVPKEAPTSPGAEPNEERPCLQTASSPGAISNDERPCLQTLLRKLELKSVVPRKATEEKSSAEPEAADAGNGKKLPAGPDPSKTKAKVLDVAREYSVPLKEAGFAEGSYIRPRSRSCPRKQSSLSSEGPSTSTPPTRPDAGKRHRRRKTAGETVELEDGAVPAVRSHKRRTGGSGEIPRGSVPSVEVPKSPDLFGNDEERAAMSQPGSPSVAVDPKSTGKKRERTDRKAPRSAKRKKPLDKEDEENDWTWLPPKKRSETPDIVSIDDNGVPLSQLRKLAAEVAESKSGGKKRQKTDRKTPKSVKRKKGDQEDNPTWKPSRVSRTARQVLPSPTGTAADPGTPRQLGPHTYLVQVDVHRESGPEDFSLEPPLRAPGQSEGLSGLDESGIAAIQSPVSPRNGRNPRSKKRCSPPGCADSAAAENVVGSDLQTVVSKPRASTERTSPVTTSPVVRISQMEMAGQEGRSPQTAKIVHDKPKTSTKKSAKKSAKKGKKPSKGQEKENPEEGVSATLAGSSSASRSGRKASPRFWKMLSRAKLGLEGESPRSGRTARTPASTRTSPSTGAPTLKPDSEDDDRVSLLSGGPALSSAASTPMGSPLEDTRGKRSRRAARNVCYHEPSLHTKLRRDTDHFEIKNIFSPKRKSGKGLSGERRTPLGTLATSNLADGKEQHAVC